MFRYKKYAVIFICSFLIISIYVYTLYGYIIYTVYDKFGDYSISGMEVGFLCKSDWYNISCVLCVRSSNVRCKMYVV